MEEFLEYLKEHRHMPEESIEIIRKEKINPEVVLQMTDTQLAPFIPKMGDRIAAKQYCSKRLAEQDAALPEMVERLRFKRDQRQSATKSYKLQGNKNAQKEERRFEIGWKHDDGELKQVRERRGGGIRHMKGHKSLTVADIQDSALKFFFPDGKSAKFGRLEDYSYNMRDIADSVLDYETTVQDLYNRHKTKMLRVYFCTEKKENEVKEPTRKKHKNKHTSHNVANELLASEDELPDLESALEAEEIKFKEPVFVTKLSEVDSRHNNRKAEVHPGLPVSSAQSNVVYLGIEHQQIQIAIAESLEPSNDPLSSSVLSDSGEVTFSKQLGEEFDDTVPLIPNHTSTPMKDMKKIRLHRGHVFEEMNQMIFAKSVSVLDTALEIEMIEPNGLVAAEDTGGVLRDVLSEYWNTFYKKCTNSTEVCVPVVRHDMRNTWPLAAEVLIVGYKITGYFPTRLAKPFLQYCLGEETGEGELVECFLQMIPKHELEAIKQREFKSEEFMDVLEAHDVKCVVNEYNWDKVLAEVAHKELIQEPAFIADTWGTVLKKHLQIPDVAGMYKTLEPSPRKVISVLSFPEGLTKSEEATKNYLKKFLRVSNLERLKKFLRFCTGADLMVCSKIEIQFIVPTSEFARTPTAHTCGCVLQLPTYPSAAELSEEMGELLDSNVWVMDFV